jgi:DNA-binding transcriptional LysR family regulator
MKLDALDGMVVFVAVAEAKNFRVAGERLGVSASVVSQALREARGAPRRLPLAHFLTTHPHVRLDLVVSDAAVDIVAAGSTPASSSARSSTGTWSRSR